MDINKNRFQGFADIYDEARPKPPNIVIDVAKSLTEKSKFDTVVDLGSGTGLSTSIWLGHSEKIIGIEPTDDMRNLAQKKYETIQFLNGSSYNTNLQNESVDIVTCSQSFHWMEPLSTIDEVCRILRKNGLFIVYDCIWPVFWNWKAERAYNEIVEIATKLNGSTSEKRYSKDKHFENFILSKRFSYVREMTFENIEKCNSCRFINIALSQGSIQDRLKDNDGKLIKLLQEFRDLCDGIKTEIMRVSYKMYIGLK
jgi:ubiquinone/menaquinone biosynthesis C-methylase UbiE